MVSELESYCFLPTEPSRDCSEMVGAKELRGLAASLQISQWDQDRSLAWNQEP